MNEIWLSVIKIETGRVPWPVGPTEKKTILFWTEENVGPPWLKQCV
jgi:hypothetical protein